MINNLGDKLARPTLWFRGPGRAAAYRTRHATLIWMVSFPVFAISGLSCAAEIQGAGRFERRQPHMGTEFVITAYGDDPRQIGRAMDAAFAEIGRLDALLSNYQSESEVSRLSASSPHSRPVPISDALWQVMREADRVSRMSGGAFDVTIGPLTKLWRRSRRTRTLPSPQRWESARRSVGFHHIRFEVESRAVQLTLPNTQLDLGGIAKGLALDRARQVMQEMGVVRVLINGGGDIIAGCSPPERSGWRVGVSELGKDDPIKLWLSLENQAVATSGDLWQFIEIDGNRYSHLIDPRTGEALKHRSLVTVIAPTGINADAWASALSVMDLQVGLAVIRDQTGLDARVVRRINDRTNIIQTSGFRDAVATSPMDE